MASSLPPGEAPWAPAPSCAVQGAPRRGSWAATLPETLVFPSWAEAQASPSTCSNPGPHCSGGAGLAPPSNGQVGEAVKGGGRFLEVPSSWCVSWCSWHLGVGLGAQPSVELSGPCQAECPAPSASGRLRTNPCVQRLRERLSWFSGNTRGFPLAPAGPQRNLPGTQPRGTGSGCEGSWQERRGCRWSEAWGLAQ